MTSETDGKSRFRRTKLLVFVVVIVLVALTTIFSVSRVHVNSILPHQVAADMSIGVESRAMKTSRLTLMDSVNEHESFQEGGSSEVRGDRMLVKTGAMDVNVKSNEIENIVDSIDQHLRNAKGSVERQSEYLDGRQKNAKMVLRIPVENYDSFVVNMRTWLAEQRCLITSASVNVEDVGKQYVDTKARYGVLESTHGQLKELMEKAKSVDEVLNVQRELSRTVQEMEVHKRTMQYLENQSSMATLNLRLFKYLASNGNPELPFLERMFDFIVDSWQWIFQRLSEVVIVLIFLITPFAILLYMSYGFLGMIYNLISSRV